MITQATPTIATTPSAGGPVGSTCISDTATVSGGFTPTGNVTFNLFAPGDTDLHRDPGVHLHQPAERRDSAQRHLGHVPEHRGGHLPLDGHLQR